MSIFYGGIPKLLKKSKLVHLENYICIKESKLQDGKPVFIFEATAEVPYRYKVCYNNSMIVFKTYEEALSFVNKITTSEVY